jgi:tetratricopeptide (TPR) repeat protein
MQDDARRVEGLKKRGNRLFDQEDFKKAEETFSEALLISPNAALFANRWCSCCFGIAGFSQCFFALSSLLLFALVN